MNLVIHQRFSSSSSISYLVLLGVLISTHLENASLVSVYRRYIPEDDERSAAVT